MAIIEAHMQCGGEAKLRWLKTAWKTANRIKDQHSANTKQQPLLLIGGGAELTAQFKWICKEMGIKGIAIAVGQLNVDSVKKLKKIFIEFDPWGIINALAIGELSANSRSKITSELMTLNLALWCLNRNVKLLTFSCDFAPDEPLNTFSIKDDVNYISLNWTTQSKVDEQVLTLNPDVLIIRPAIMLNTLNAEAVNEFWQDGPLFSNVLNFVIDFMIDDECGIWYFGENEIYDWPELARKTMLHLN